MAGKSILGIDLRICSVKVIEIIRQPNGYLLGSFGIEEIPYDLVDKHPEKEYAQARALQKILSLNHIKTREAVAVIGGKDVLVKRLAVAKLSKNEIAEAVKWKFKDDLAYPVEEAIIDFVPIGKSPKSNETYYLAVAANKKLISGIVEVAHINNIKLVSIIPVPLALFGICGRMMDRSVVNSIMYMGRRSTSISFYKNGIFLFDREIQIGGEDLTSALATPVTSETGTVNLSREEAEKYKQQYGLPPETGAQEKIGDIPSAQLQALVRPALEKISGEISRTFEYFKSQEGESAIKKVYLTGGSSRTKNLTELLSQSLGLPFESINPSSLVAVCSTDNRHESFMQLMPQLTAALGGAIIDQGKELNLLPLEEKEKWRSLGKKYLNPLWVSVGLAVVVMIIYFMLAYVSNFMEASVNSLNAKIAEITPKVSRLEELEKSMRHSHGRQGIFKSIEISRIGVPSVLEDISYSMPNSVILDKISFVEETRDLKIKGLAFSKGDSAENNMSKFVLNLSKAKSFEKIQLIQATKAAGYLYEAFMFEITGTVKKKI